MPDPIPSTPLGLFIHTNRDEILRRCHSLVHQRVDPAPTDTEVNQGIPAFLAHLIAELEGASSIMRELRADATQHGHNLFFHGFTISQVVHDYGDVCQSVTGLAVDLGAPISPNDFRTLNRCLDDAIAKAVSEYSRQQRIASDDHSITKALELQNMVFTATTALEALRSGHVGPTGATGDLLARTLAALRERLTSAQ